MKLDKYKTNIEEKKKEEWVRSIIERNKVKQALLQFEESSQLNENLFFISMYFLRNIVYEVKDLSRIFTIKELSVLIEFLTYYDETQYVFEGLVKDGIFPSKTEKGSVN